MTMSNVLYVDISAHNPPASQIDWQAYKNWSGGLICLKASEGDGIVDPNYRAYVAAARAVGLHIIHYHYARADFPNNTPQGEAQYFINTVGVIQPGDELMLDYEGGLNNEPTGFTPDWALQWAAVVAAHYGKHPLLYSFGEFISAQLQDSRLTAFPLVFADPTGDPNNRPPAPAPWSSYVAVQWSWGATVPGIPGPVDADVWLGGGDTMTLIKDNNGAICNQTRTYQIEWGETPTACGPFTASLLKYAGVPSQPRPGGVTSEMVDQWADHEYTTYLGPNTATDFNGSSIENMHQFFTDAVDDFDRKDGHRLLHYWDIGAISDTSDHVQDVARIKRALDCGYPVAATTLMSSVIEPDGNYPYPGVGSFHIFTIVGYTSDGYFLVNDEDRPLTVPWPCKYLEQNLYLHWASVIQLVGPDPLHPWLLPIPSGDPLTWPSNFNAQNFNTGGTKTMEQQFNDYWPMSNPFTAPGSKIRQACLTAYLAKVFTDVFPLNAEVHTVNWVGGPITKQGLSNGYSAEYDEGDHHVRIYNDRNQQVYDFV